MRSISANINYYVSAQKSTFALYFLCLFNYIYLVMSDFILIHTYHPHLEKAQRYNIFLNYT